MMNFKNIKKKAALLLFMMGLFLPVSAHAEWLWDIFNQLVEANGIHLQTQKVNNEQLDQLKSIKNINQDQLDQVIKLTSGLTGTRTYGNQHYQPNRFNWGQDSNDWQSILSLVGSGGGDSYFGREVRTVSSQFPINDSLGSSNKLENDYYRMQAQTTVASRAGSQVAFRQLNKEAEIVDELHKLIDLTKDNKSSVDLNNRLVAENAMINIQQAKLLAMLVQQTAMDSQEKANRAKENAEFFDIK